MADPWEQFLELWQGTWFNVLDPYYGYLHIKEYKSEDEGGEAVAIIHAKHGESEPPIWYQGVWKPTDLGIEVVAGPYHWKQCAIFPTPKTRDDEFSRLYFYSFMNGYGQCNFGKLGDAEEQKYVDSLKDLFPNWQDEKTYWADYPNATWPESQKYMRPIHTFDGGGAPPSLIPGIPPEDQVTHNGGQLVPPRLAEKNPPPPVGDGGQKPPPGDGGDGGGGGEKPPPGDGGDDTPPPDDPKPPAEGGKDDDGKGTPTPSGPSSPSGKGGGSGKGEPGGEPGVNERSSDGGKGDAEPGGDDDADEGKGWFSRAVDKTTDVIDDLTGGATHDVSETVDDAVDKTSKAVGNAATAASDAVFGKKKPSPPGPPPPPPAPSKARSK